MARTCVLENDASRKNVKQARWRSERAKILLYIAELKGDSEDLTAVKKPLLDACVIKCGLNNHYYPY
jgi:hypothetical protein